MQIFQLLRYSGAHWLFTLLELMGSAKKCLGNQKTFFCLQVVLLLLCQLKLPPALHSGGLTDS